MDIKREVKEEPTLTNKPPSLTHSDTPQKSQPSSASGATKSPSASQSTAGGSESSMNDTFEQPESDLQDLNIKSPRTAYEEAVEHKNLFRRLEIDLVHKTHVAKQRITIQLDGANFKIEANAANIKNYQEMYDLASSTSASLKLCQTANDDEFALTKKRLAENRKVIAETVDHKKKISKKKEELQKDLEKSQLDQLKIKALLDKLNAERKIQIAERDNFTKQLKEGEAKFSEEKASLDAVKENTAKVKELAACLQKQNENTLRDKENLKRSSPGASSSSSKVQKTTE